ncbi:MAG: malto-oligosyltrehalose synthase [Anaerolineae bacterium]
MNASTTNTIDQEMLHTTLNHIADHKHIPRATYRVQFNADFTFQHAREIVPYLHQLGISDLYASPILQARPGSTHGYDICDYGSLNSVLGTDADFEALVQTLREHEMGLLVDIVPNHMGVDMACNLWWKDVLENGPSSPYASFFDIDWHPVKIELVNKVLLPILEDQYGNVLESGKITLGLMAGRFVVQYNGIELPLTPDTYNDILSEVVEHVEAEAASEDAPEDASAQLQELQSIVTALGYLPPYDSTEPEQVAERTREKEIIKARLAALVEASPTVQAALDETLNTLNGDPADSASYDRLDMLLQRQPYRMAFWRVATDEINYRRFFDINDMAAIHIERPEVFTAVHQKIVDLLGEGHITGLRIDHPDGLWGPSAYFQALQESYMAARLRHKHPELTPEDANEAVKAWFEARAAQDNHTPPLYVVAEKILSETEPLPLEWAVDGTTGYDFLTAVNGLLVDVTSESALSEAYHDFIGYPVDFREMVYNAKHLIMDQSLASEIRSLSRQLERITEVNRRYRDFTLNGLTQAIREVIASLSIYRTYITEVEAVSERDQSYVLAAVLNARRRNPNVSRWLFSFVRDTLLLANLDQFQPAYRARVVNFVMRFQQMTGPVMAKSVEDTSFYIYNRLVSLNEVGGHPDQFGMTLAQFHEHNTFRCEHWPHAMLSTSTHDTKRSEDVRARIDVLSEMPEEWHSTVQTWARLNAEKKTVVDDEAAPDANDEYLYYQTLLGMWEEGESVEVMQARLQAYMTKAANEAKVHTSWINTDDAYNDSLHRFVEQTLADQAFMEAFLPLQRKVAHFGRLNALVQTLLKLTAPGVPDVYQGNELWNFSLVDPDNRRAVDFGLRQTQLNALLNLDTTAAWSPEAREEAVHSGMLKLLVVAHTLRYRRAQPHLFVDGSYEPVTIEGPGAGHGCAFIRRSGNQVMLVAVPLQCVALTHGEQRLPIGEAVWGDTTLVLPERLHNVPFTDVYTGQTITPGSALYARDVFGVLPFALLTADVTDTG